MDKGRMAWKIMKDGIYGVRQRGRSKFRMLDDLKGMKVTNWKKKTQDRKEWRLIVKEAEAHPEL